MHSGRLQQSIDARYPELGQLLNPVIDSTSQEQKSISLLFNWLYVQWSEGNCFPGRRSISIPFIRAPCWSLSSLLLSTQPRIKGFSHQFTPPSFILLATTVRLLSSHYFVLRHTCFGLRLSIIRQKNWHVNSLFLKDKDLDMCSPFLLSFLCFH